MKRRRSRNAFLSVSAAALLASAPLLSGCSTDSHPGAAAVVGDERISLSEVQSQVETVRDAQRELPNGDDLMARSNTLTRQTVAFLVYVELVERAAEDHGVEVTRSEVLESRQRDERIAGGADELRQAWLTAQGQPLAGVQIDMIYRSSLLYEGLGKALGIPMDSPDFRPRVDQELTDTAEEIGIEINPRYGEWDAQAFTLTDEAPPWLRVTGDAAA